MFVGFLKREGLLIYKVSDSNIVQTDQNQVKQPKNLFGKKVLVISREMTFHTKRNYPTLTLSKLRKALQFEVRDIFSVPNPRYHFRTFQSKEKSTTVDIWCWNGDDIERIKANFPYQYIIPEDILWIQEKPTLYIFKRNGVYHLIASTEGKFLGSLSLADLTDREIELFIAGLPLLESPPKIKILGEIISDYKGEWEIVRVHEPSYPYCLENLNKTNLKDFKEKASMPIKIESLLRIPLYGLIAYSVFLYSSIYNYKAEITEIKTKISELDKKIASLAEVNTQHYQSLTEELNKKISSTVSPLSVMDMLAERIPVGCVVNRLVINEKNLEVYLTYDKPLDVIEFLENAPLVKSVNMKGAPVKQAGKNYNFILTLELESDVKN